MNEAPQPARWERLAALFDELAELDAAARAERLAELRRADPALADELARMLAADAAASGPLDHGLDASLANRIVEQRGGTESLDRSGETIGEYRLISRAGRGGMGEVYLAERTREGFTQRVALKLLRRGVDTEDVVRRFAQERRILAQLEHPGIARLIDGGVAPDGSPFLVMEYVEGEPLTAYALRQQCSLEARLALVVTIASAVDYAHRRLVVHRDLKPSNILVTPDGAPKLLDFGIAKLLGERGEDTATARDVRVMSPAYAAPEQILGEPVGTATDVYSLGVVLYELLTGRLPHARAGRSIEQLARDVGEETIERPSAALRRGGESTLTGPRYARRLEGDLDTIVLHALAREPERRYPSAAAFADDLVRFVEGKPIRARPDTWTYRVGKFVQRHRGGVAAALLTLVALVAALGIALWQAGRAREEAARAAAQAERADHEAKRAEREAAAATGQAARVRRVKDFMMSIFLQEDPLRRTAGTSPTLAEAFDLTLGRIEKELGNDPALQADLYDDFGEIEAGRGDLEAAKTLIGRARELAERAHGPQHPAVAESLLNLGVLEAYSGNPVAGEPMLERAVAILEPHATTERTAYLAALGGLTNVRREQGRIEEAHTLIERELALRRERPEEDPRTLAITLHNAATVLLDLNRHAQAEAYALEAVALLERVLGPDNANLIPLLGTLENVAYGKGDLAEEARLAERRLALARRHFEGDHRWVASALGEAGYTLARSDPAAGIARMHEALAMFGRLGGKGTEQIGLRLAAALDREGRGDEARAAMENAWTSCVETSRSSQVCLLVRAQRAALGYTGGDPAPALAEIDAARADLAVLHGERPADEVGFVLAARARVLDAAGRRDEAVAAQREAVAQYEGIHGPDHPTTRAARERLSAMSGTAS